MEYKIVGGVKYNKNNYLILMNKKLDNYYIGVNNNGELIPLELTTYLELQKYIFKTKKIFRKGIKVGDTIDINPMVKIKKRLVPLALATSIMLSLNGCGNTSKDTINKLADNGITVTKVDDSNDLYFIDSLDTDLIKEDNEINIEKDYFDNANYDEIYFPKDINQYLNYGKITWEDIKKAIKDNKTINDEIEKILIEGIDNIDKKNYNYDLTTLYYNLNNIKIEYCEDKDLPENMGGVFDAYNCDIKISKSHLKSNRFKHILFHEVIGHGSQEALVNVNGKKILFTNSFVYITIDNNGNITDLGRYGQGFNEAFADVISSSLQNKKIDCNKAVGYPALDYYCNTIINSCNGNFSNYVTEGTDYLTEILENNNYDPYEFIYYADYELYSINQATGNAIPYSKEYSEVSFINPINTFITTIIDNKLNEGLSKDEVYEYIKKILKENDNLIKYIDYNNAQLFYSYTDYGDIEYINTKDILAIAKEYIYGKQNKKSK